MGRGDDIRPFKLLKYFRKKILRYPSPVRNITQLHRRAEGGSRQHNQSLNSVSTFLTEFHDDWMESTDDLSPLATRYAIVVPSSILSFFRVLFSGPRITFLEIGKSDLTFPTFATEPLGLPHKNWGGRQQVCRVSNPWRIIVDVVIWMDAHRIGTAVVDVEDGHRWRPGKTMFAIAVTWRAEREGRGTRGQPCLTGSNCDSSYWLLPLFHS